MQILDNSAPSVPSIEFTSVPVTHLILTPTNILYIFKGSFVEVYSIYSLDGSPSTTISSTSTLLYKTSLLSTPHHHTRIHGCTSPSPILTIIHGLRYLRLITLTPSSSTILSPIVETNDLIWDVKHLEEDKKVVVGMACNSVGIYNYSKDYKVRPRQRAT